MIISVWRYSHLVLAVSSFLLLTLASLTGIVLAFDPLTQQGQGCRVKDVEEITLAEAVPVIREKYKDVQKLSIDDYGFVTLEWTNEAGDAQRSYIDPRTGRSPGAVQQQSELFKWVTALHRSLFLHETGRFLVGLSAFLLILIVISGFILVIQRQKGLRRYFARIERDNWAQYYHAVFGRIVLFPILFIALTGAYLTVTRFEWIRVPEAKLQVDTDNLADEPAMEPARFPVFLHTKLSSLQSLEFTFSAFPEDYFTVKLHDRVLAVNQFTGDIIAQAGYSKTAQLAAFSLRWHTGRSGAAWAIIMIISSGYSLFFIYSGFVITFRRRASVIRNKFRPDSCRIVILVGSENGSTMRFAQSVYQQLLARGQKVYITDMDKYTVFPALDHLVVMTSTYGLGDPPSNARRFAARLQKYPQARSASFSVVAFGSRTYADYCKFGILADLLISHQPWAVRATEFHTVNERSPEDFGAWCTAWSEKTGLTVTVSPGLLRHYHRHLHDFTVTRKMELNPEEAPFLVRLKKPRRLRVQSGDLLAIYPGGDHRERLYSIGMINDEVQLSVKLHKQGLGSEYLYQLTAGRTLPARIVKNQHFHFPSKVAGVIMISNGTGIAPFLGMLHENSRQIPCYLYCGFRYASGFALYREFLLQRKAAGQLKSMQVAFSREGTRQYVMDLLSQDAPVLLSLLAGGAVLMICGSLAMQNDVLQLLDDICQGTQGLTVEALTRQGKILTDCY
jgi:sulfite reductase (NADPH) flavoprotein alpha-component